MKKQWSLVVVNERWPWYKTAEFIQELGVMYGDDNIRQRRKRTKKDKDRVESGVVWGTCPELAKLASSPGVCGR